MPPNTGWLKFRKRLQGALSLSISIESQRDTGCISSEVSVFRSSDLVSITILHPATLIRFLHTFYQLHRLSSTSVIFRLFCALPAALIPQLPRVSIVLPRDSFNQCTNILLGQAYEVILSHSTSDVPKQDDPSASVPGTFYE